MYSWRREVTLYQNILVQLLIFLATWSLYALWLVLISSNIFLDIGEPSYDAKVPLLAHVKCQGVNGCYEWMSWCIWWMHSHILKEWESIFIWLRPRVSLEGRSLERLGFLFNFVLAIFESRSHEPLGFSFSFVLMYFWRVKVLNP